MQIKVFKAGTMKEAMAAMKAELGDDAVILHSKKYKEGGILGLGSKEFVEITAAVEETSLPKREETVRPKPTLFSNANISRYKTAGTAQGVAQAERDIENLSVPRPTLTPKQSDELTARVAAKSEEELPKFDEILDVAEEIQPFEVESQSDAEILREPEKIFEPEEKVSESAEVAEEKISEPAEVAEEKISEPVEVAEEKISESAEVAEEKVSESAEVAEEKVSESAEVAEEKVSESAEVAEEKISESAEVAEEKVSESAPPVTEKKSESVANSAEKSEPMMTPEQFAQSQAMMFAQINQMQITQMMQQAMAQVQAQVQAQAQAQAQVAEMAEQMREVHRQRMENSGKIPTPPPTPQPVQMPEPVAPTVEPVQDNSQDKIKQLEDEIAQMKALLAEVLGRENRKGGVSLHEALRRQEVSEDILTEMATKSGAGETLADCKSTAARVTLSNYLVEHLNFSSGIKLNRHGVRIAALLGTTGVGKTTTLAKIAAKFVLENGVNAALITADTYRISAVDQLKTYSDILGLPLEIVYNPAELNAAIERHKHKELILIDTAGRSQQNEYQMRELEDFLKVNPRIEKHLVVSATTKFTDAQDIMRKFAVLEPEKVIITKVDETGSLGMIINLLRDQKVSLSYITTGQSVPDDIEAATADILTDFILKKVQA